MTNVPSPPSDKRAAIDAFLEKPRAPANEVASDTRGRLIFAIDATGSREPTWDIACQLQGEMFQEVAMSGGLDVQLVYHRARECRASRWVSDGRALAGLMEKIDCRTGHTQIGKILNHAQRENARQKVAALVFVGDCVEEEPADLYAAARELAVPASFVFQEGDDPMVTEVFHEMARLTKGAHCRFDPGSARQLAELQRAVAVYAVGGREALLANKTATAEKLLLQLPSS